MAAPQPIREERKTKAERILNLTLEIIHLLDGEDYIVFKISNGLRPSNLRKTFRPAPQPLPHCDKKVLEVTNKIIELLSGESAAPEACIVTIKEEIKEEASWMEEWGYFEAQKDPEDRLTSLDDLNSENTSELRIIISGDCEAKNDAITPESSHDTSLTTIIHEDHMPEDNGFIKEPYSYHPIIPSLHSEPQRVDLSLHPSLHKGPFPDLSLPVTHPSVSDALQSSGSSQTRKRPFSCPECGKCFALKSVLTKHRRRHTEEKPYSCPECGKCFVVKHDLTRHQRRHTGEKPYLCSVCWKGFFSKGELTRHQTTHSKEKPFSCPQCEGSFTRREHLILHLRSHTGEKPYSCAECGKCFSYKSNLITHERTHRGEKPYLCPECGKCFSSKFNLLLHQRAHRGEKPYSCSECGKCFTKTTNLLSHLQTHTGGKPFSCSECGKCFSRKMDLIRHNRSHSGGKPCSCSQCEECVSRREALINFQGGHSVAGNYVFPQILGQPENRA